MSQFQEKKNLFLTHVKSKFFINKCIFKHFCEQTPNTFTTTMTGEYYQRSWLDGCFDFMHFGHANAILQSRMTANTVGFKKFAYPHQSQNEDKPTPNDYEFFTAETLKEHSNLVSKTMPKDGIWVGLHSDEEILKNKGSLPVMRLLERCYHVSHIRWVTPKGVVKDVPYVTELDHGVNDAFCEYVLHGDDLVCDADGKDCYYNVRQENRFLIVKRTEGVSTTEIIQRILTKSYEDRDDQKECEQFLKDDDELKLLEKLCLDENANTVHCSVFDKSFDNVIVQGSLDTTDEKSIVFYNNKCRSFDMLNAGDIETLVKVKENSDKKLIVALNIDNIECVNNFRERLFSLVSCSVIDGVIINPSLDVAHNFIEITNDEDSQDRVFGYLTPDLIKKRIISSKEVYEARNKKKLEG